MGAHTPDERWRRIARSYASLSPPALRLAYVLTGDRAAAEDAVQDAFIQVSAKMGHVRDENALATYFNRAVINNCHKQRRSWLRRGAREATYHADAPGYRTDRDVVLRISLVAALQKLEHKPKVVLTMTYLLDHDDHSISTITGWPVTTIKSVRQRGLKKLREVYQHEVAA